MIEICNLELSYEGEEKIFSSLSLKIEKNKPVLIISGLLMGAATSGSLSALLPALSRLGFKTDPR